MKETQAIKIDKMLQQIKPNTEGCILAPKEIIYYMGKARTVQRLAYAHYFFNGDILAIPEDKWVTSTCRSRNCINKEHLVLRNKGRWKMTEEEKRKAKEKKEQQQLEQDSKTLLEQFWK